MAERQTCFGGGCFKRFMWSPLFPRTHGNVQRALGAIRQQIINFIETSVCEWDLSCGAVLLSVLLLHLQNSKYWERKCALTDPKSQTQLKSKGRYIFDWTVRCLLWLFSSKTKVEPSSYVRRPSSISKSSTVLKRFCLILLKLCNKSNRTEQST